MTALLKLIEETERWRAFHKARGSAGQIEALGADIRLKALKEALAAVSEGGAE
jgi:hypothetical protein